MKALSLFATLFLAMIWQNVYCKEPSSDFYKKDIAHFYAQSSTAAHIRITGFKLVKVHRPLDARTGQPIDNFGYRTYHAQFEVIETFKGRIASSSPLTMTIESPGEPPLGNFIALLSKTKRGEFYFTDNSLFMIPARADLISYTKALK